MRFFAYASIQVQLVVCVRDGWQIMGDTMFPPHMGCGFILDAVFGGAV